MSDATRSIEVVREALPGEVCQDGDLIAEDDLIPCEEPSSVVLRIRENGVEDYAEVCARHADPLLREAAEQPGGDAILP